MYSLPFTTIGVAWDVRLPPPRLAAPADVGRGPSFFMW